MIRRIWEIIDLLRFYFFMIYSSYSHKKWTQGALFTLHMLKIDINTFLQICKFFEPTGTSIHINLTGAQALRGQNQSWLLIEIQSLSSWNGKAAESNKKQTTYNMVRTIHTKNHLYLALLGMVSVFQENRVRIHVKFVFAWKTCKLFPMQTKRKHNKIVPSVCIRKRKPIWFFVFYKNRQKILCIQGKQTENTFSPSAWWERVFCLFPLNTENFLSVFVEYKESNSFPFLCENGWNNFIMFSLCLRGKQSNCFPGKHELYMYSNPVFLEYRDHPQQWQYLRFVYV